MNFRNVLGVSFLALGLFASAPVLAKKAKDAAASTEPAVVTIQLTGNAALDGTLQKALDIDTKIVNGTNNLMTARANVNTALGAATDAPLATALADMKSKAEGKLKFAMNGTTPTISAGDGMPDNVKAGLDAVNSLVAVGGTTVTELAGLGKDITALIDEAKALPGKIPSLGLDAKSLMGATKIVGADVKAIGGFPAKISALTEQVTGVFNDIKAAFGS